MKHPFSKQLEEIPPSGIRAFFDLVLESNDPDIISLGVGEPDFDTPWPICEDAIRSIENGLTAYSSNQGLFELRKKIAEVLEKKHACQLNPKANILVTSGVSEGLDLIFRVLVNPGDEVIVPTPCYVCYAALIRLLGGKVVEVDTASTQFQVTANAIRSAVTPKTKAVILCTPNNPTGTGITKVEMAKIVKIIKSQDLWCISDEIYTELSYDAPAVSLLDFPEIKSNRIVLNGFSKSYAMTGFRVGYMVADEAVISRALKIHQYAALCAPITSQYAAIAALKQNKKVINQMKISYLERRNLCISRFKSMGFELPTPTGAFYCFPNITSTGLNDTEFAMALFKRFKVAVVPGSVFGAGGSGHIRCCYATELSQLMTALERIATFVNDLNASE
jgi:aminotransferase